MEIINIKVIDYNQGEVHSETWDIAEVQSWGADYFFNYCHNLGLLECDEDNYYISIILREEEYTIEEFLDLLADCDF